MGRYHQELLQVIRRLADRFATAVIDRNRYYSPLTAIQTARRIMANVLSPVLARGPNRRPATPALSVRSKIMAVAIWVSVRRSAPPSHCDATYPSDTAIKVILDNHSAHVSKETNRWLGIAKLAGAGAGTMAGRG